MGRIVLDMEKTNCPFERTTRTKNDKYELIVK